MSTYSHIIHVPEGEEKGTETLLEEITAENFPNLRKLTDIQVQGVRRAPNKINPRGSVVMKMSKIKDRILKAAREKQHITSKGNPIRSTAIFQQKLYRPERGEVIYLKC